MSVYDSNEKSEIDFSFASNRISRKKQVVWNKNNTK